jgi:hypothetical protein
MKAIQPAELRCGFYRAWGGALLGAQETFSLAFAVRCEAVSFTRSGAATRRVAGQITVSGVSSTRDPESITGSDMAFTGDWEPITPSTGTSTRGFTPITPYGVNHTRCTGVPTLGAVAIIRSSVNQTSSGVCGEHRTQNRTR